MQEERKTLEERATMTDIERLRHSASHVLATAILKIWPEAQFGTGPPVENGFYYDVDLPHRISPDDFEKIEAEMKNEIKANHPFERMEVSRDEALELGKQGRLAALGERAEPSKYKLDIIENIPADEKISLYSNGDFIDLCAGPHVMRTGNIGAFKLTNVASAYYKGDEEHRLFWEQWEARQNEAHEMAVKAFMPDLNEPGMRERIRKMGQREINQFIEQRIVKMGQEAANTFNKAAIDNLIPTLMMTQVAPIEDRYYLKAMNCPHHHKLFAALPRSYRDLPLRLAEYGTDYRYEKRGELFGLMRVGSLQMNDAHSYVNPEQFASEVNELNERELD